MGGFNGFECPGMCPMQCGPGNIVCPGGFDSNGCKMADLCIHAPIDTIGGCPAMCPVNCPENYMKCPGGMYGNGCVMPDNCIPMAAPVGTDGTTCMQNCPTLCSGDQMICPGGTDYNGCKRSDTCIPTTGGPIGLDGENCPIMCPIDACPTNHTICNGGFDPNGCQLPNVCLHDTGLIGNDGTQCPFMCPTVCGIGQLNCPGGDGGGILDGNGCPVPDTCKTGSCDDNCFDQKPTKTCKKLKKKGKCSKKGVWKKCKLTCEKC